MCREPWRGGLGTESGPPLCGASLCANVVCPYLARFSREIQVRWPWTAEEGGGLGAVGLSGREERVWEEGVIVQNQWDLLNGWDASLCSPVPRTLGKP